MDYSFHSPVSTRRRQDLTRTGNILILNHTGWLGGAELSLLRYLERTGIHRDRIICAAASEGPLCEEISRLGYETHPLSIPIPGLQKTLFRKIASWVVLSGTCIRLASLIRRRNIILLYANSHRGAFLLSGLTLIFRRRPLITHLRDRISGRFKKFLITTTSGRIICISDYVARGLGVGERMNGKLIRIPSGVDTDVFKNIDPGTGARRELGIPENAFVFGMFCQVLPWKGVREYIEASIETVRACDETCCILVGDDSFSGQKDYFDGIKRMVTEGGLTDRIIFTGFRKDVHRYISCSDVVVSASIKEPLGQTLLQAMAMAKPVIATRSGGPVEIVVDGDTGLLVEPADSSSLSRAMVWMKNNPGEALKMGARGKERFSGFFLDTRKMAERIDDVLLSVIESRD